MTRAKELIDESINAMDFPDASKHRYDEVECENGLVWVKYSVTVDNKDRIVVSDLEIIYDGIEMAELSTEDEDSLTEFIAGRIHSVDDAEAFDSFYEGMRDEKDEHVNEGD